MLFSESNANISSALAKAWSAIQTPKHNAKVRVTTKKGSAYTFEYTDLNGILDAVRPIFIENKLSIMQNSYSTIENNQTMACVETIFLHESGEYVKSYPLKFPAAQSMQDFGGQITYMKRYSLAAMLGISTEKDDDANGASGNNYNYQDKQSNSGQSRQQNAPRQQQQQKPSHLQPMSPEQYEQVKKALTKTANLFGADTQVLYNGALQACKIPDKNSKLLSANEANILINYLLSLKPQQ